MKHNGKNILLISVAILLVGGSFLFAEYRNNKAKEVYVAENVTVSNNVSDTPAEVDTDEDGSKDWEEILFGTNPNDPKSKPSSEKSKVTSDVTKTTQDLSQIDLISREFFARYMELRQMGVSSDKLSQEELVTRTAGNIVLSKPAVYTIEEILTKPDSGNEGVKLYGEQVGAIFKKYAISSRNEAFIAKESIENDDPDILKEIDPIILSYKNVINSLIKVSAPQSIAIMHVDLLNAMNGSLFVAQSLRESHTDAIKGIQGVKYYETAAKDLYNAISSIKSYLKYLGIYENVF